MTVDRDSATQRLAAASDLLRRARTELVADHPDLPEELVPQLERLRAAIAALAPDAAASERRSLLALLDEAQQVSAALGVAHERARAGLRAAGVRLRAGAAYRRADRLRDRADR